MRFRKVCSMFLSAVMLASSMSMAAAATPATVQDKLAMIEKDTYGVEQTGAITERINKLDRRHRPLRSSTLSSGISIMRSA